MADVTANYLLPFFELGDPPDLASATEDLATLLDTILTRMDTPPIVTNIDGVLAAATAGNFAKNANARYVFVEGQAAGAASGSLAGAGAGQGESGGGGGGGYFFKVYAASALSTLEAYSIGKAGVPAAAGANTGGNADPTTFKACTANGGLGGVGGTAAAAMAALGGLGGTATGGDKNIQGGQGGAGRVITSLAILNSRGGESQLGKGIGPPGNAANGNPGQAYGAGASGAFTTTVNRQGGAGGIGCLRFIQIF